MAHRAALGRVPYSFGHQGFPQPLHSLQTPWWQVGQVHFGAAAAAVAAGVTLAVVSPHHLGGHHPAGGTSAVAATTATASAAVPGLVTHSPRAADTPTASAAATVTTSATAGHPTPSPSPTEAATGDTSVPDTASPSDPAAGTLSVGPAELDITAPGTGTITLSASGGDVDWSVSVPAGKAAKDDVSVTPASGTLADGDTVTITVTVQDATKPKVKLTFSPGGKVVEVIVG